MITIGAAQAGEFDAIRELLVEAGLPVADMDAGLMPAFVVLRDDGFVRGTAAIEARGTCALLRSVAVAKDLRGRGHGTALVRAAETLAAQRGLAPLYLLTTTADGYFNTRGFRQIERATVPPAIQESREFSSLCPQSAIVMVKP
jgi:amino-acid N-acetyltransferase